MRVHEVMTRDPRWVRPDDNILAVAEAMKEEDAGFMPVCDGTRLAGVITDRDIVLRCLAEGHANALNEPVAHCMSADVLSIGDDAELEEAASLMERHEVRRLAVTRDGALVGVLSHGNVVQATGADGAGDRATLGVTRGA